MKFRRLCLRDIQGVLPNRFESYPHDGRVCDSRDELVEQIWCHD